MGWADPDVYSQPEKFGLTPVAEAELSPPCWDFDIAMVWFHGESGKFYAATDSGCSCPSPFESFTSLSNLDGPYDRTEAARWVSWQTAEDHGQIVKAAERIWNFVPPERIGE